LTHRATARAVTFATAQVGGDELVQGLGPLRSDQTWVIYMGGRQLPALAEQFLRSGLGSDTPAAVVANGTRPTQEVIFGTLANIAHLAAGLPADAPSLLIVGHVVEVGEQIAKAAEAASARGQTIANAASAA